jgi:hypothetical protein
MVNNKSFSNCVTLDQKMLMASDFGIQLCLGCSLDLHKCFANVALVWNLLAFYCYIV